MLECERVRIDHRDRRNRIDVLGVQICHATARSRTSRPVAATVRGRDPRFQRVLGTYVQRLATIAHGDGVCTTHIPMKPLQSTSGRR